jgi:hypothetical protein
MRMSLLATILLGSAFSGATCLPLRINPNDAGDPPTQYGVSVLSPSVDRTVAEGTQVSIRWTAFAATGVQGTASLYVESRSDLTQTVLVEGVAVIGGAVTSTSVWDTTGHTGSPYVIYASLVTNAGTKTVTGPGRITVDARPVLTFTQPTANTTYKIGDGELTIGWEAYDPEGEGDVTIALDPDDDPTSGNEIFIRDAGITESDDEVTFDWTGEDLLGEDVAAGTYRLIALLSDDLHPEFAVDSGILITVEEADDDGDDDDELVTFSIIEPEEDVDFLTTDASLQIVVGVNQFDDVLIDLKIDTDDNHGNGNELTILSQMLVTGGTETVPFDWDGSLVGGGDAGAGIYKVLALMNTGGTSPRTAVGDALIYRRTDENQPLIAILQPAQVESVQYGDLMPIRWRDNDPTGTATITLTIDDDNIPDQGEDGSDPEDMAEIEIVSGLDASTSFDVYFWSISATLPPGTYYVFAYIEENPDGGGPGLTHVSVGPAPVVIKDPAD